jgi:hypothetical protein
MVLICDNAPYHHKREIGSFASKNEQQLIEIGLKDNIEYINIPTNIDRLTAMADSNIILEDVHYLNDEYCCVVFDPEKFKQRSSNNKPFVPTIEEMKVGMLKYIKEKKPELLECKVEKRLEERGHCVLWTPPYSPDLQPIELFWTAGKNNSRLFARNGITMKKQLNMYVRDGMATFISGTMMIPQSNRIIREYRRKQSIVRHYSSIPLIKPTKHSSQFATVLSVLWVMFILMKITYQTVMGCWPICC